MCFSIESNYASRSASTGPPSAYRANILAAHPVFYAGVVYDLAARTCHEFKSDQAVGMVQLLSTAEALVSRNGRRHDILILEALTSGIAAKLWETPHCDLTDLSKVQNRDHRFPSYFAADLSEFKAQYETRLKNAKRRYPAQLWGSDFGRSAGYFQEIRLAQAHYEVRRTHAIWKVLIARHPDFPSRIGDG